MTYPKENLALLSWIFALKYRAKSKKQERWGKSKKGLKIKKGLNEHNREI